MQSNAADADSVIVTAASGGTTVNGGDSIVKKSNGGYVNAPSSKVNKNWVWVITYDKNNGVKEIKLGASASDAKVIWPTSTAYETYAKAAN